MPKKFPPTRKAVACELHWKWEYAKSDSQGSKDRAQMQYQMLHIHSILFNLVPYSSALGYWHSGQIVQQIVQHITQQRKMQSQMADQRGAQFGAQVSKRFPPAWSIGWSDLHLPWHGILLNFGTTLKQHWDNFGIILSHQAWIIGWPNIHLPWHHLPLRSPPQAHRWENTGRLCKSRDQENNTKLD